MKGKTEIENFDHLVLEEDWVNLLKSGVFRIEFIRLGTQTRAIKIGTLDQRLFPVFTNTTGVSRPAAAEIVKFWSFKDKWWRSFNVETVVRLHKIDDPDTFLRDLRLDMLMAETPAPKKVKK